MSAVERARFAHWIDVHETNHIGVDSDALWSELELLEAVEGIGPRMPRLGDVVRVKYGAAIFKGAVTRIQGVKFQVDAFSQFLSFTIEDLVADVEEGDSAPQ